MNKFTEALNFRHACKLFDDKRTIPAQDFQEVLEAGRLSPSSFGLEPWHFLVVTNKEVKAAIRKACGNQIQLTSCSHAMIILFRKASQFQLDSHFLRSAFARRLPANSDTLLDKSCQYFIDYYTQALSNNNNVENWAEMQCYIAAANMMTAAAYIGIDSCAIGGFEYQSLEQVLTEHVTMFNPREFGIALGLTFGYRANQQPKKYRFAPSDIITYI
ncbi:NAD(P)H-dependent oxidoreductase [Zophobihabitans entericus]|uniref:NAD(P)H-dependent oxidoreductase n=1 Tax=Zophobihabitans entericus TaxID=1635327 RepID=A0A6G9IBI2_9GAMM|nr:NAD(P)H-dependent oxidoreductase [Zophobihabitans entericus]QIQ20940.1 NAD(P)H-dependent oxidoreductase [Zophobihabitans entericus]